MASTTMEREYRHIGYFPTVQLSKLINLPYFQKERGKYLWRLRCWRERLKHKETQNPLPYLRVADIVDRNAVIDYSWMRHGFLKLDEMQEALTKANIDDMVVEEMVIVIPKEYIWPKHMAPIEETTSIWERDVLVAARFERRAAKGVKDEKFLDQIRQASEDFLKVGGKLSTLDLVSLQDSKKWAKGASNGYDLDDKHLIYWTLYEIDIELPRIRTYRRGKGDVWELTEDEAIKKIRV